MAQKAHNLLPFVVKLGFGLFPCVTWNVRMYYMCEGSMCTLYRTECINYAPYIFVLLRTYYDVFVYDAISALEFSVGIVAGGFCANSVALLRLFVHVYTCVCIKYSSKTIRCL